MICPACKNEMIDIEYDRIELDYCTHCRGVWFDAEELELLFEAAGLGENKISLDDLLSTPEASTDEKERKCPICNRSMKKMGIGQKPQLIIDACQWGDGLWFDGGEVAQLVKQLPAESAAEGSQQKVLAFLGEVFKAEE